MGLLNNDDSIGATNKRIAVALEAILKEMALQNAILRDIQQTLARR